MRAAVRGPALAFVAALALVACGGDGGGDNNNGGTASSGTTSPDPAGPVAVGDTVALTAAGRLITFNRAAPNVLVGSITVSGLESSETLLGLDFRPVDGKLYAVSSLARVYVVEPSTGVSSLKSTLAAAIGDTHPFTGFNGTRFAVGFNPATDRLRVVSDTGQNSHINVDTGAIVTDLAIHGATASVTAIAHTNALPGVASTRLFDIDGASATLFLQDDPNSGTLGTPVPLGTGAASVGGFCIDARDNTAYAALAVGGGTHLYTVPLAAGGAAVDLGTIGSGEALLGLALKQPTVVRVVALAADGATLLFFDAAAPNTITATVAIAGLDDGESVVGFDYRPADKRLYGLTSSARIVTLDTSTGAAAPVSTLSADPSDDTAPYGGLVGTRFAVDFDPVQDRLRVVSDTGANLRVDVDSGTVITDTDIGPNLYGDPRRLVALAYGSNYAGATDASLFGFATNSDELVMQSPPNDGTLVFVNNASFDLTPGVAMDIAGGDNGLTLVAAQIVPDAPWVLFIQSLVPFIYNYSLYRNPNTSNYAVSEIGGANGPPIIDIAIQPF